MSWEFLAKMKQKILKETSIDCEGVGNSTNNQQLYFVYTVSLSLSFLIIK
jgi:hypothetical protein